MKSWRDFANTLFTTEEADPGYLLLARAALPHAQKLRYVLAWCTFYNPGIAAVASQYKGAEFYAYLVAQYPTAKRASERRHFRGKAGLNALASWGRTYPNPEALVESCWAGTYLGVRRNMKSIAQMGDYFYWKLADIQDTVFAMPVDFTGCEKYMPKVPKQGAVIIGDQENLFHLEAIMAAVTAHISGLEHPLQKRGLLLQEAETVCCIYKQYAHGKYHEGLRSAKAYHRLKAVQAEAPSVVNKLLAGLYAGGIWNESSLKKVAV